MGGARVVAIDERGGQGAMLNWDGALVRADGLHPTVAGGRLHGTDRECACMYAYVKRSCICKCVCVYPRTHVRTVMHTFSTCRARTCLSAHAIARAGRCARVGVGWVGDVAARGHGAASRQASRGSPLRTP